MTESAWHWDEGNLESEDPSIGVPAASLARVPIRHGERQCSRRKSGDLTFDPTTSESDPEADLFAQHRRDDSSAGTAGAAGTQAVPTRTADASSPDQPDPEIIDANALLASGGRAALARAKPAVRRRNPLAHADQPASDAGRKSASNPAQMQSAAAKPAAAAAPVDTKSGWRSAFSRWRKKVALISDGHANGVGRGDNQSQDAGATSALQPSRNSNLYDYWTNLRRGRKMPTWSEIRVDEVARAWPNSFVVSFEPHAESQPGGTPVVRARRITPQGVDGHDPDALRLTDAVIEWILATARAAVKHGEPVQDRERFAMSDGMLFYGIVAVPFSGDRAGIEHILCHLKQLQGTASGNRSP